MGDGTNGNNGNVFTDWLLGSQVGLTTDDLSRCCLSKTPKIQEQWGLSQLYKRWYEQPQNKIDKNSAKTFHLFLTFFLPRKLLHCKKSLLHQNKKVAAVVKTLVAWKFAEATIWQSGNYPTDSPNVEEERRILTKA